jgi:hypothetical protein
MRSFDLGWLATAALRLLVLSFIVGIVLMSIGFEPETMYEAFYHGAWRLIEFGLGDIRHIGRILMTGAMVVAPVWILLWLLQMRRAR